jgi:sortase A
MSRQSAADGRPAAELASVALVPTPAAPPTRLVIPSVSIDAPVLPTHQRLTSFGGERLALSRVPTRGAAGWHDISASLGVAGNTVINGHNSGYGEVFRDLYRLEEGDTVIAYSGDTPFLHTVSEVVLLEEEGQTLEKRRRNARYVEPTDDERLTLVTCHPYGSLRYRLVVVAHPGIRPTDRMSRRAPQEQ